jgi:hypothetical protein
MADFACVVCGVADECCEILVDAPRMGLVTLECVTTGGSIVVTAREYAEWALRGLVPVKPLGHARAAMALIQC